MRVHSPLNLPENGEKMLERNSLTVNCFEEVKITLQAMANLILDVFQMQDHRNKTYRVQGCEASCNSYYHE